MSVYGNIYCLLCNTPKSTPVTRICKVPELDLVEQTFFDVKYTHGFVFSGILNLEDNGMNCRCGHSKIWDPYSVSMLGMVQLLEIYDKMIFYHNYYS